jgi:type IX secretion system PorP/SprF family membrane protein
MNSIRKNIIIIVLSLATFARAQDFHLSLYDAAPLFLNPAMTGLVDSKIRVHGHFRNQWNAIAYKPFTTALVSVDAPSGKWGFGGQMANMRAGVGNYNVFEMLGSCSYAVPLGKNKYHNLSFGLQIGFKQKRLEYDVFTFDSQWSSQDGGSFDKSASSNENFVRRAQFQEVANFGALYYFAKQQSRINPFLGASFFNLTRPKESFFGSDNRLPMRMYFHTGLRFNINELLYFVPKVLIYNQGNITQQTYALDAGYFFKGEKVYALAGYVFRTKDASVIYAGLKKDNFIIKIGYDFNTSTLRTTTKTRGAYEISLTWLGRKAKKDEIKNCPRL